MTNINEHYKVIEGNLFDAPKGSILVHACNAQGSWGNGVAAQFLKLYPEDYEEHKRFCKGRITVGKALITSNNIGCLFTSNYYGRLKDSPEQILVATQSAVNHLFHLATIKFFEQGPINIHSPKINAGLFHVPWEQTEEVIKEQLGIWANDWDITWTVWELK